MQTAPPSIEHRSLAHHYTKAVAYRQVGRWTPSIEPTSLARHYTKAAPYRPKQLHIDKDGHVADGPPSIERRSLQNLTPNLFHIDDR